MITDKLGSYACMAQPARLDAATLTAALSLLGLPEADALAQAMSGCPAGAPDPLGAAARASAVAMKLCAAGSADAELFALWVADLALATRLDWARPVPLLAVVIVHPSLKRGAGGKRPRLFDRLVALGAVANSSGARPFRIYGL